ncbi:uncharacterized protein LOC133199873 [Saccostrea echinata]|uniref:uncharacterized protein LOC133199873 n=1 Tax=Saccostrea echinata TaxID=191078 RepID=UPI002A8190E5|nr:uncharacterized protein LOC133199873 [Saccostrea echinata]
MAGLKDSLRGISSLDSESLSSVQDVREFVNLLLHEKVFTERDVITLQYLMRTIGRTDLETECVDYATSMKERLCYFQQEKQADGCTRVKLHVVDDIENFIRRDSLIERWYDVTQNLYRSSGYYAKTVSSL